MPGVRAVEQRVQGGGDGKVAVCDGGASRLRLASNPTTPSSAKPPHAWISSKAIGAACFGGDDGLYRRTIPSAATDRGSGAG